MRRVIDFTGKEALNEQTENPSGDISKAAYAFQVFLTDYYRRVKTEYKVDFDTFMIIVVVMQHGIYESQKVKAANSSGLDNLKKEIEQTQLEGFFKTKNRKLGINSISNVLEMPEETTRRKIEILVKKGVLQKSKVDGIILGKGFVKTHSPFADKTIKSFKALIRQLNNSGMIDDFVKEKI
jgi:predicted DNA-binding transcriptional regulator